MYVIEGHLHTSLPLTVDMRSHLVHCSHCDLGKFAHKRVQSTHDWSAHY